MQKRGERRGVSGEGGCREANDEKSEARKSLFNK
nr:MAG TPA: hypothetical protein [Caudoviricetes sp.]